MPYAVANGAVGKSPLIDKMNQLPKEQLTDKVSGQLEQQVFDFETAAGVSDLGSFDFCQEEIKRQLNMRR